MLKIGLLSFVLVTSVGLGQKMFKIGLVRHILVISGAHPAPLLGYIAPTQGFLKKIMFSRDMNK